MIFLIGKIWLRDKRLTIKSCVGVVLIGATVAGAMLIIRLVGEQRLQRVLNMLFLFRRRPKVEKLNTEAFVPDNQT